ncbi:MAG: hypothetical protein JRF38_25295 [Deltaproteobacteria bacterium]|jgi:uncharacterized lipoprotein YajG|nr:hypothetical protein [Deltaproteobacteria bacterium]
METRKLFALSFVFLAAWLGACAPKPFLKVQYQLPSTSAALTGETISVTISDRRKDTAFLSSSAEKSLKNFNGTFSLVVLRDDGSGNLIGAYDMDSLMKAVFTQRLKNEGAQVSAAADSDGARLEIELKEFKLDIVDRKWVLRMSYQAGLTRQTGVVAEESVNGSAERVKLMGKTDAEKILGELVTDMVNKLDVATLFQKTR